MTLNSAALTDETALRAPRVKPKYWREGYLDKFDQRTLWYDAIWSPGQLHVIAPSPNTLWPLFKRARFALDGAALRVKKIKRHYRHMTLSFAAPDTPPQQFEMQSGDHRFRSAVSLRDWDRFTGRNVLMQISRDNDLDWIADNIRHHRTAHGLDAVVLFDNSSTAYSRADLTKTIADTGVAETLVVNADYPFGPTGIPPFASSEMFLQTALYNVARHRWLGSARAVLCVDVDELVVSENGQSIFDQTCNSRFGYIRFRERKRYLSPGFSGKPRHADHLFARPEKRAETKWCLVPNGPADIAEWRVHKLEGSAFNLLPADQSFGYLHCIGLHTGWKSADRLTPPDDTSLDAATQDLIKTR